jgi:DNA-binding response OmpR family regulator
MITALTILLVEDEQEFRDSLHELLEDAGFGVSDAGSGDVGLRMLKIDQPLILVTDINMPGSLDGVGLAKAARLLYPDLPVLFMTGRPELLECALKVGKPGAVLKKPFKFAEMLAAVQGLTTACWCLLG